MSRDEWIALFDAKVDPIAKARYAASLAEQEVGLQDIEEYSTEDWKELGIEMKMGSKSKLKRLCKQLLLVAKAVLSAKSPDLVLKQPDDHKQPQNSAPCGLTLEDFQDSHANDSLLDPSWKCRMCGNWSGSHPKVHITLIALILNHPNP